MQEEDYFDDLGVESFIPDKSKKSKDKLGHELEELTLGVNDKVTSQRCYPITVLRISMNPTELLSAQMDFTYATTMRALILRPGLLCA